MKASELRVKSVDELNEELAKLYKDYFVYQMQKGLGQLGQTHLLKNAKRDIARVKTVMKQLS